ncbi:hypothetical protein [Streptomyces neyagawaensis]|uniref:Uncharacterized protein n=1 Tax=Streptomyces neyagawaensis TaxID=42238 RepID=A0ABV3BDT3_9ACTN
MIDKEWACGDTTSARCVWLKKNDYGRLKVNGRDDPLRLDRDRGGVACGGGRTTTLTSSGRDPDAAP